LYSASLCRFFDAYKCYAHLPYIMINLLFFVFMKILISFDALRNKKNFLFFSFWSINCENAKMFFECFSFFKIWYHLLLKSICFSATSFNIRPIFSKAFKKWFENHKRWVLILGLDAAGRKQYFKNWNLENMLLQFQQLDSMSKQLNVNDPTWMYVMLLVMIEFVYFVNTTFTMHKDWFLLLIQMTQQELIKKKKNFTNF
jgi:hypothetical protein